MMRTAIALLLAAALALGCVPALAEGSVNMYVSTGNSGRLNLRTLPSVQSDSLGLYANGTQVTVESTQNGWAFVTVGGLKGYMLLSCLTSIAPIAPVYPVPWAAATPVPTEDTTLYINTGNTGRLHLREQPTTASRSLGLYPNGTAVQVTARVGSFAFVRVAGITGYMMQQFLTSTLPGTVTPPLPGQPTPAPFDAAKATAMYVMTGNTGKLHLREQPTTAARSLGLYPNGTAVQAINLGNGWAQVQVGGMQGYMMLSFLAYVSGAPTQAPAPTPADGPTAAPGDPTPVPAVPTSMTMYVATGNTGKLHLRENVSKSSASLGLYPNGTIVTVWGAVGDWYQVTVAGKNGYMMRKFLAPMPGTAETPAPGATPVPAATAQPGTATVTQPNNSFVNLRSYRNSEAKNVIAKIPSGTVVDVLEWGDTWCRIRVNGQEGWIVAWYLK